MKIILYEIPNVSIIFHKGVIDEMQSIICPWETFFFHNLPNYCATTKTWPGFNNIEYMAAKSKNVNFWSNIFFILFATKFALKISTLKINGNYACNERFMYNFVLLIAKLK